jgi:hypothetical protein
MVKFRTVQAPIDCADSSAIEAISSRLFDGALVSAIGIFNACPSSTILPANRKASWSRLLLLPKPYSP